MRFKTIRQFKRCARVWALLIPYQNPDCDAATAEFCREVFNYAEKELEKMKLPEGWREHSGEYNEFEKWFIENT